MAAAGNDSVLLTASMDGGSVNSSAMWSSMSDHVADALRVAAERRAKVAHLHSQMQDLEIGVLARGARTQRQPRPVTAVARPGRALGEPGWSSHDESDSRQHTARSTSDWSVLSSVMTASSAVLCARRGGTGDASPVEGSSVTCRCANLPPPPDEADARDIGKTRKKSTV